MTARKITLLIAASHFIIGNVLGYLLAYTGLYPNSILMYAFLPYTFVWILSSLVGWDWLSYFFVIGGFFLSLAVFFPIGMYFAKKPKAD